MVAFEQTLLGKQQFFDTKGLPSRRCSSKWLDLMLPSKTARQRTWPEIECEFAKILAALEELGNKKRPVYVLVDELGKHLEYALAHNPKEETYFFQQVAEAINHPDNNLHWVGTLHQGFDSYATGAADRDILEWEKVSGRFVSLNFNEPATTLLRAHEQEARLAGRPSEKHRQGQPGHRAHTVDAQGIR